MNYWKKISANKLTLSIAESNTTEPLNRIGAADLFKSYHVSTSCYTDNHVSESCYTD